MAPSTEVLVVGAGPSGLVLALALVKNDISVRIIDKNPEQRVGQRGAGIMPRTMELLELLGIAKTVEDLAVSTPLVKTYELERGFQCTGMFDMAPYTEATPAFPYLNILCLGQDKLEAIMRQELEEKYNTPIELGVELLSFEQDDHGVNVRLKNVDSEIIQEEQYAWVLGTDGARGIVRKLLGISFAGETNNVDKIVVGDVEVHGLDPEFWHMWGDASTTLVSLRPTEVPTLFNFILAGKDIDNSMALDLDGLRRTFALATGLNDDVKFGDMPWVSNYRPNIRMVDTFGHGRVYLAGDSAHVHSFTGGQGMNTGIQDSFNLAWKVALVQQGLSPPTLLKSYTVERIPVVAEMLRQTTALLNQTFVKNARPSVWGRGGSLLQLGVNYRRSSIVLDEQDSDSEDDEFPEDGQDRYQHFSHEAAEAERLLLKAGDRAPDAPALLDLRLEEGAVSTTSRLFDHFDCASHTVLIFSEDTYQSYAMVKEVNSWRQGAIRTIQIMKAGTHKDCGPFYTDLALEDTMGHAYDAYSFVEDCLTVVVRPDGFIGAIVQDSMGLRDYFRGVFYHNLRSP